MSYRIGLYGCGCRTQQILERALEDGVAKVTLCHDISEKNANALAEKYNAKVCSLDELLSSDEVDMYLISLFPAAHPDALLKAAKTGKPIYIEKPVAVFINDIQRLMPLTTRTDIHVGLSYRYIAVFRDLLDLVNSGKIGDLISVNCNWVSNGPKPEYDPTKDLNWRYVPETGGELTQHCCHTFEWFCALGGDFESVVAMNRTMPGNKSCIEDLWDLTIKHKSGCQTSFHFCESNSKFTLHGYIEGTKGTLEWEWNNPSTITFYESCNTKKAGVPIPVNEPAPDALEEFIRRMKNNEPAEVSVADGLWASLPPCYARKSVKERKICDFPADLSGIISEQL